MVRFKNRWLLAELIFPEELVSKLGAPSGSGSSAPTLSAEDQEMASTNNEAESDTLPLDFYPARPAFMVPSPAATSARGLVLSGPAAAKGQAGAKARSPVKEKEIWFAIKETIIDVYGDAGWALVGSSFNVRYYSPTTQLAIFRVAREHVRTLWGGLTFLREIAGRRVALRVLACSGTIKKAQHAAIGHSRRVTARYLAHVMKGMQEKGEREREAKAWEERRGTIEQELAKMED